MAFSSNTTEVDEPYWTSFLQTSGKQVEIDAFDETAIDFENPSGVIDFFKNDKDDPVLLLPAPASHVRGIHSCFVIGEKLCGLQGTEKAAQLVETHPRFITDALFSPPKTRGGAGEQDTRRVPTSEEFLKCKSADEFSKLASTTGPLLSSVVQKWPKGFVVHPNTYGNFFTGSKMKAADLGMRIILETGEIDEDPFLELHPLLVHLWFLSGNKSIAVPVTHDFNVGPEINAQVADKIDLREQWMASIETPQDLEGNDPPEAAEPDRERERSHTPVRRNRPSGESNHEHGIERPRRSRSRSADPSTRERKNRRTRDDADDNEGVDSGGDDRGGNRPPENPRDLARSDNAAFLQAAHALTAAATLMYDDKQSKKSVLGRMSERQQELFTTLSARDWSDETPELNSSVKRLVKDKDSQRLIALVQEWTENWLWTIHDSGLLQLLARGHCSVGQREGFTAFWFFPKGLSRTAPKERERIVRSALGDTDVTDDMVKDFAKQNYHIPVTFDEALNQLNTAAKFLDLMTQERGIASAGHWHGRDCLERHGIQIKSALEQDPQFLVKFIGTLDRIFQAFLKDLLSYADDEFPIFSAKRRLRHQMEDNLDRLMTGLNLGSTPNLRLPDWLNSVNQPPPVDGKLPPRQEATQMKTPTKTPTDDAPIHWHANPDQRFRLPPGKPFGAVWGIDDESKKHKRSLPSLPHHRTGKPAKVCAKHQVKGKCLVTCPFAHVVPRDLDPPDLKALSDAMTSANCL